MQVNVEIKDNILIYRGIEIDIQAVDEYGAYYNTACLEINVSGYIGEKYYYNERYEITSIEDAIKWIDKNHDEHLQKHPIENS